MLVYFNRGKKVELNSNEIEGIDINVKNVVGSPFLPTQYTTAFTSPKIKVKSVIEIVINNVVVDEYTEDVVVGNDMLGYFDEIKNLTGNELLELVRNSFENEKDILIEIVLRNRILN